MVKQNRTFGSVVMSFALLAGCQAPPKPQDESVPVQDHPASGGDSSQAEMSEGVVGPDEAFFAAYYLEQVFNSSRDNANPRVEKGSGLAVAAQSVSAFDFKANFTDQRLQLMAQALFLQGDGDADGALSGAEFSSLKLDHIVLGNQRESLTHAFSLQVFLRMAGPDELLQSDEMREFLRDIGPEIRSVLERSTAQDQRRDLIKSWEKILLRYDADNSGKLSLQEQRELRKDRALLLARLVGE